MLRQAFDYRQDVWPLCGCGLTDTNGDRRTKQIQTNALPQPRQAKCKNKVVKPDGLGIFRQKLEEVDESTHTAQHLH